MKLSSLLIIPFVLQGIAMVVDEFYFHHKRVLPRWERLGHPLDTLTVLACFGFLLAATPSETNASIFAGLAAFSSLFVTKDEPVHVQHCSATESWLHAVLFVLHPLVFISAGLIWYFEELAEVRFILSGQIVIIFSFLIYQIGYWNFYAKTNAD